MGKDKRAEGRENSNRASRFEAGKASGAKATCKHIAGLDAAPPIENKASAALDRAPFPTNVL